MIIEHRMRIYRTVVIISVAVALLRVFICRAGAESFFEYYFTPETESADGYLNHDYGNEYSDFIEMLPEEIKRELPEDMFSDGESGIPDKVSEIISFSYIWQRLGASLRDALFPSIRTFVKILGILLLGALLRAFQKGVGRENELCDSIINAGMAVAVIGSGSVVITLTENFRDFICGLMNGMVPMLGAVYAAGGNAGTGAVQSGGILLLVTLCQNLFAYILLPSVKICLVFAAAGAVFPEIGIRSVSTAFRNTATGVMLTAVTLFSFVLGIQNSIAQSADTFGAKSVKFAVGNLIPIIGSAVSDSVDAIGGSLALLKSACGGAAIVIIILLVAPTIFTLISYRLTVFFCKCAAGVLGCTGEEGMLGEIGSVVSMLIAFSSAITLALIFAMTLFCRSALALNA